MASMAGSTAASAPRSTSILTPIVDFLCVGGLSIIVFIPMLLSGQPIDWVTIGTVAWAQLVINYAHFMASYRIVYRDKETILKHKWATIGIPLIMLVCLVYALFEVQQGSQFMLVVFFTVASAYLAWHYTGQAWGMMVTYAHLNEMRFDRLEYWLIRGGLRILLTWHVVWFLRTTLKDPSQVEAIYQIATWASFLAALMGVVGLVRMKMRTGKNPPFLALVAWASIFVWYMLIAKYGLVGLFLVQFAHALQYLEFPTRIEINRAAKNTARSQGTQLVVYCAGLVIVTMLVTTFVPGPTKAVAATLLGAGPDSIAPVLISYFIAIHHFFTDGVIWKLRNPDVQVDLFAHARPVAATVPVPPLWWQKGFWIRH